MRHRFGTVLRRRHMRSIGNGLLELWTPQYRALIHPKHGTIAIRNAEGHYFHLGKDENGQTLNDFVNSWIPRNCEYPLERHEVSKDILDTVCPPLRPNNEVCNSQMQIWENWNWPNPTTRDLCLALLTDTPACIELVEFCRGVARSTSAFTSVTETTRFKTEGIREWFFSGFACYGKTAPAAHTIAGMVFDSISWPAVYHFFCAVARVTPVSQLPFWERSPLKRALLKGLAIYTSIIVWPPAIQAFVWAEENVQGFMLPWWHRGGLLFVQFLAIALSLGVWWLLSRVPAETYEA
jgi:hypothetical protein